MGGGDGEEEREGKYRIPLWAAEFLIRVLAG